MKKLDRFLLRDMLSDGPAGTVYKADEILPGDNRRAVALKILPRIASDGRDSKAEPRFFSQVKVLAQLAVHPHIVTIYAMGLTDGYPWLAMEFLPQTLEQAIAETPAPPADVLRMLEQVARGLTALHALKPPLIHQDIKPANILIDAAGHYKITDFSLATVAAGNSTQPLATVRYAAPELLSSEFGRIGPATDLYALGHVAYELALGAREHRRQFPAVFEGNTGKEPPPNKWMMWHASIGMKPAVITQVLAEFPPTLSEVIARLMAKPLAQRYASAQELLSDLSVLRHELASPVSTFLPPPAPLQGTASPSPAHRAAIVLSADPENGKPPPKALTAPAASAVPPMSGNTRYWVRLRGKVTGPYDLASLQRQVKQGQLSRLHQVSADQVTWKQAAELEGLYGPNIV